MRSKSSFNKCNDLDLNEIKSNQWQDKETKFFLNVSASALSSLLVGGDRRVFFVCFCFGFVLFCFFQFWP